MNSSKKKVSGEENPKYMTVDMYRNRPNIPKKSSELGIVKPAAKFQQETHGILSQMTSHEIQPTNKIQHTSRTVQSSTNNINTSDLEAIIRKIVLETLQSNFKDSQSKDPQSKDLQSKDSQQEEIDDEDLEVDCHKESYVELDDVENVIKETIMETLKSDEVKQLLKSVIQSEEIKQAFSNIIKETIHDNAIITL